MEHDPLHHGHVLQGNRRLNGSTGTARLPETLTHTFGGFFCRPPEYAESRASK